MWRLEDNLQELILAFYHVGSKDETQVSSKHFCPLSHLHSPIDHIRKHKSLSIKQKPRTTLKKLCVLVINPNTLLWAYQTPSFGVGSQGTIETGV